MYDEALELLTNDARYFAPEREAVPLPAAMVSAPLVGGIDSLWRLSSLFVY